MLVVVLGTIACLVCLRNNILIRRHIDECLAAISAIDNDIHTQCRGRRRRRGRLTSLRHRVAQGRNRVLLPGHHLVHGHCGQHLQPTVGHGDSTLWTALLSSSLGYLLPNPSLKREDGV